MPVTHEIVKSKRLIVVTVDGEFSFAEIRQNRDKMLNNPDFDQSFNMLWDTTRATKTTLSSEEIRQLAQSRVMGKSSRVAFVAPLEAVFGMLRMYEIYYSFFENPAQTRSFKDRSEALEWLNQTGSTD